MTKNARSQQCSVNKRFIEMQIESIDFDEGIERDGKRVRVSVRDRKCKIRRQNMQIVK